MNYFVERLEEVRDNIKSQTPKETFEAVQSLIKDVVREYGIKKLDPDEDFEAEYHESGVDLLVDFCRNNAIGTLTVLSLVEHGWGHIDKDREKLINEYEANVKKGEKIPIVSVPFFYQQADLLRSKIKSHYS